MGILKLLDVRRHLTTSLRYEQLFRPRRTSLALPLIAVVVILTFFVGPFAYDRAPKLATEQFVSSNPAAETFYNAANTSACERISNAQKSKFDAVLHPTIYTFVNGNVLQADELISAPQEVCIIVAIPQRHLPFEIYPDSPVPGSGPDIIHLYINSSDVRITFPPLRPLPNQPNLQQQIAEGSILYFAETVFFNGGDYDITVEQEWSNWRWAQQWFWNNGTQLWNYLTDVQPFNLGDEHLWQPVSVAPSEMYPTRIRVVGGKKMPSRPKCDDRLLPAKGKWYRQQTFRSLFPELTDEWGFTWQGDQCQLDYFNPIHMFDCLANKTIHVYGDSMIRRVTKHVVSGGQWCHDPEAICQDGDDALNDKQFVQILQVDEQGQLHTDDVAKAEHFKHNDHSKINFGNRSKLYFTFLTALTNQSSAWMDPLYEAEDLLTIESRFPSDRLVKPGATARAPPYMDKADLVILGFGAWDQAYTDNFEAYRFMVSQFRDAMMKAYEGVPIIMRLSNSWCCRDTDLVYRRFTGGRVQRFDDVLREVFEVEGGKGLGGRISVFDPSYMNGRPEVLIDYGYSTANHPRAAHGRIEMQMMMNSICVKDDMGHSTFRFDRPLQAEQSANNSSTGEEVVEVPVWIDVDENAVDEPQQPTANNQQWGDDARKNISPNDQGLQDKKLGNELGELNEDALLELSEGMPQPVSPPPQAGQHRAKAGQKKPNPNG